MSTDGAIDRAGRAITQIFAWAWRETAALLPERLASSGASRRAALITLDADGAPASTGGAVRSWLGRWRYDAKLGRDEAIILLDSSKILLRTVPLSPLAARNPQAAVRLEAETLSPIRLEDAALGVAPAAPDPERDGAMVELAIARRADVDAAALVAADRALRWRVAADFGPEGPRCVFASGAPTRTASPILMGLLAALGVLACLTALDLRLARDAEILADQRDALLADVRGDRGPSPRLDTVEGRAAGYPVLADVLNAIAESGDARLERVSVEGRRIVIETVDGRVIEHEAGRP